MSYEIHLRRMHADEGSASETMGPARNRIFYVLEGRLRIDDTDMAVDQACHSAASPSIQAIGESSFLCWELAEAGAAPASGHTAGAAPPASGHTAGAAAASGHAAGAAPPRPLRPMHRRGVRGFPG